jgi:hypothetical protein
MSWGNGQGNIAQSSDSLACPSQSPRHRSRRSLPLHKRLYTGGRDQPTVPGLAHLWPRSMSAVLLLMGVKRTKLGPEQNRR